MSVEILPIAAQLISGPQGALYQQPPLLEQLVGPYVV